MLAGSAGQRNETRDHLVRRHVHDDEACGGKERLVFGHDLDACDETQGAIGQMGEGMAGVDGQRRQNGQQRGAKILIDVGPLCVVGVIFATIEGDRLSPPQ